MRKLFDSTNNNWSFQTEFGDPNRAKREGWCAAASAIWCCNILIKHKKPIDSKPDGCLSGILQVKCRWTEDKLGFLRSLDLLVDPHPNLTLAGALLGMANHPGVYWFVNSVHAMAADTRDENSFYWYDIEQGLFSYDHAFEWIAAIRARYGHREGPQWHVARCIAP